MNFLLWFLTTDSPLSSVEAGGAAIAIAGPNTAGAFITDGAIACAKSAVCICDKAAVGFKANREALANPWKSAPVRVWKRVRKLTLGNEVVSARCSSADAPPSVPGPGLLSASPRLPGRRGRARRSRVDETISGPAAGHRRHAQPPARRRDGRPRHHRSSCSTEPALCALAPRQRVSQCRRR